MKILKRPDNIIFDTENPDNMVFSSVIKEFPNSTPLHHCHTKSNYDFMSYHFKDKEHIKHPIFNSFGSSFFYCIEA